MASSVAVKVCCVVIMCMLVAWPMAVEGLNCGQVSTQLSSCINYLRKGGKVPPACCNGIKGLKNAARTTNDRRTACKCLITAAKSLRVNMGLAAGLPGRCGVSIPYKISPSTNCNNVK